MCAQAAHRRHGPSRAFASRMIKPDRVTQAREAAHLMEIYGDAGEGFDGYRR